MRPLIELLDVAKMEWQPLGPAGLYSKLLSRDPETGARTALQRLVPQEGFAPPQIAHYHNTYEEIIGVAGRFTFDSKRWIEPLSYLFHPPRTVHGFKSAVPEESWFLSRVGRDLDVNLVHDPIENDIYPLDGTPAVREARAIEKPLVKPGFEAKQWGRSAQSLEYCSLSIHPESGEGSALLRMPPGWKAEIGDFFKNEYLEWLIMDGEIFTDGARMGLHCYSFRPSGMFPGELSSPGGALVYLNFGPLHFS